MDLGPLLEQLQIDSVRREIERDLPYEPVDELRRCRFGAVRLPVEAGGSGWDLPRLFDAVVALAAADALFATLRRTVQSTKTAALQFPSAHAVQEMADAVLDVSRAAEDLKLVMDEAVL